jgi:RNA polymerase sigma-70 factor, ECF subfamily
MLTKDERCPGLGGGRRMAMSAPSDAQLVEEVRRGRQEAFSRLVERHQGFVFSLCYTIAGHQAEAEDLAQESFVKLYRSLGGFRRGAALRPWLRKITTSVCIDSLRKRRDATVPLDDVLGSSAEPRVSSGDLPEEAALIREARHDVRDLLARLSVDYRAVLALRYLEDLTYQEIADALAVPVSTVETRLFRARRALARALGPPGHERDGRSLDEREEVSTRGLHVEGSASI